MDEINASRLSLGIHTMVGLLVGLLSTFMPRAIYAGIFGVFILIVLGYAVERIVKKKGLKWWLGNGAVVYLLIWWMSWIILFNLAPASVPLAYTALVG